VCLAIPHKITKIMDDGQAIAETGAISREIRTDLIDSPKIGDTVLVHAGFAIEKVMPEDAEELEGLWSRIRDLAGEENVF